MRTTEDSATFEMLIVGGILRHELFSPTPRTRIVIKALQSGEITVRILNGRSSGV